MEGYLEDGLHVHRHAVALWKWEFTPAMRDGVAVDVEAIVEIPFHLAPRPKL